MPLYEFKCECGKEYEAFHKMLDVKISPCPDCGKENSKQMSAPRSKIMFKAGWMASLGEECNSEADYREKDAAMRRKLEKKYS